MMSHRRYVVLLVATFVIVATTLTALSLWLQPLAGDLTRVGRIDERDYGYALPQTHFVPPLFDLEPKVIDHEIVVLGDSFSLDRDMGWENTVAAGTGARIATFPLASYNPEDLLAREDYRARPPAVVIVQIVERNLKVHAYRAGECSATNDGPSPAPRIDRSPFVASTRLYERARQTAITAINPSYAFDFALAAMKRHLGMGSDVLQGDLRRPLFSSRRDRSLLFYRLDLDKRAWSEADLRGMSCGLRQMQAHVEHDGRTSFMVLLIPDKLSAYAADLVDRRYDNLSVLDRIDRQGINVAPIDHVLRDAVREGELDVYQPDDTHLSARGYSMVGRAVIADLRRRGIVPAQRP
jgi:hypothetical protein